MRMPILALTVITAASGATEAAAQVAPRRFEVGATIASACLTSESACGDGTHAMTGVYVSHWLDPRFEIGGRVSWLERPDFALTLGRDARFQGVPVDLTSVTVSGRQRSRLYVTGHVYRHFGSDPRARLFAGIAIGSFWDRWTAGCEPAACEPLMPVLTGGQAGRRSVRKTNLAVGAGVSGQAGLVGWRAGVQLHNFPGEHVGTSELFAGAGIKF